LLLLLGTLEITKITKAIVTRLLSGRDGWSILEIAEVTEAIILVCLGLLEGSEVSKVTKTVILRCLMLHDRRWHHRLLA
jgi:hypothetical protein